MPRLHAPIVSSQLYNYIYFRQAKLFMQEIWNRGKIKETKAKKLLLRDFGAAVLIGIVILAFLLYNMWRFDWLSISKWKRSPSSSVPTDLINELINIDQLTLLLDSAFLLNDFSYNLSWADVDIRNLAILMANSELNSKQEIAKSLEDFVTLNTQAMDLVSQRDAKVKIAILSLLTSNHALSQFFLDLPPSGLFTTESSLTLLGLVKLLEEHLLVWIKICEEVVGLDMKILEIFELQTADFNRVNQYLTHEASAVIHLIHDIIKDRDLWTIIYLTIGGHDGGMALMGSRVDLLNMVDACLRGLEKAGFPGIEKALAQHVAKMRQIADQMQAVQRDLIEYQHGMGPKMVRLESKELEGFEAGAKMLEKKNEEAKIKNLELEQRERENWKRLMGDRYWAY